MRQRLMAAVMVVLTAIYAWGLGWIAVGFARAGGLVGWGLALGVAILLALTVWVTWREVLFGMAAARLGRAYAPARNGAGEEEPLAPRQEFERAREDLEHGAADDWRAWYRVGLAYDALRDRRHARASIRRAIDLERTSR